MSVPPTPRRLPRLLELERRETLALAAHLRYVQAVVAEVSHPSPVRPSPRAYQSLGARLDARARELESLESVALGQLAVIPSLREEQGPFMEELFGPVASLAEAFQMRAVSLECAAQEARRLHSPRIAAALVRQLRQTERDGQALLAESLV